MSAAALTLLPWLGSTFDVAQLREWRISADRLSAGVVVGINYPSPAHVATLCEALIAALDAFDDERHDTTCGDITELPQSIHDLFSAYDSENDDAIDACKERDASDEKWEKAEAALTACQAERDGLQGRLDTAEETIRQLRAHAGPDMTAMRQIRAIVRALESEDA